MNGNKERVKDLLSAGKEEVLQAIVETDTLPQLAKDALEMMVTEGTAKIISGLLAGALPRVNGIRLSYQQNRFERNVSRAISEFQNQIEQIDERINCLELELREKFSGLYSEWLLDALQDEKQINKIPWYVTGYIGMMNNTTNDDVMIMFFSTLTDLTELDVKVLKLYHYSNHDSIQELLNEKNIMYDQVTLIKEKLVRNGLLESRNDEQRDSNLDEVARYVTDFAKQMKATRPKDVKEAKLKKISKTESYKMTQLGRIFLEMIGVVK